MSEITTPPRQIGAETRVAVVGLGYVGLPLAVALAAHVEVLGYDISERRVAELQAGEDRTHEVSPERLADSTLAVTHDPARLKDADCFIVTVPTPVDEQKRPNLDALLAAARTVGEQLAPGALVVFESTVWPGVTEDICRPEIEQRSGLTCGVDFHLGYSPERINPGDREHTVERIVKIVAAQDAETAQALATLYGKVTAGGVFIAKDIRTAEAAKVIENAQRDINIAFINEVAQIFHKMELSVHDVLEAANTKWNFLDFKPGLVGGHCIGVDPYYLAHRAVEIGHDPEIILAGRRINDSMGTFFADSIMAQLAGSSGSTGTPGPILVLGLSFKENVPDLRNSQVVDIVARLRVCGYRVQVHDPVADAAEAKRLYDIELKSDLADANAQYICVLGAVAHDAFRAFTTESFAALLAPGGLVADIKGLWRDVAMPAGIRRWTL